MKHLLQKIKQLIQQPDTSDQKPKSVFWRGAFYGLMTLSLIVMTLSGTFYRTGIPTWVIATGTFVAGVIVFWLARIIGALIHKGLTNLSTFIFASLFAAIVTLFFARILRFGLPDLIFYSGGLLFIIAFIFLFGSIATLHRKASNHPALHLSAVGISLAIIGYCIYFLTQEGKDPYKQNYTPVQISLLSDTGIQNPGLKGTHTTVHFTYGSGTDKRRSEYGSGVKIKTKSVNASRLLPEWKGSKAKWRERFWGFGVKEFPLNGRVWMPEAKLNCPIILIVHGNHGMEHFSDPGYAYLGDLLSSRGFIVVSVDENFINATWSGDFRGREMPVRGWLLLKHLEQWKAWTTDEKHELYKKANLDNVILAGHSRGGEAAPIAAQFNSLPFFPDDANEKFNFNFGIKGIVAIAPTDKRYERRINLSNINYLSIQGSYDSDEASFFGFRQFQRITFSDSNYHFKSGLYIHGANHGQFNTIWGKYDGGAPYKWLLNTAPQITIEDQTQIAKVYFSAFAEAVLNGNTDYQDLFINANAAADWLPETIMINTFEDSNTKKLITFEEDIDVTSGTWPGSDLLGKDLKIWREEILKFRDNDTQLNNAVVLGWESDSTHLTPSYEINFSKSVRIDTAYSILVNLTAGNPSQLKQNEKGKAEKSAEQQDPEVRFQLELFDSLGYGAIIASDKLKKLTPRLKVQFVKLKGLHQENFGDPWEPTLETFEFPFNQFSKDTNLINLKKIIFRFNQSPKGVLVLDDIAVRRK